MRFTFTVNGMDTSMSSWILINTKVGGSKMERFYIQRGCKGTYCTFQCTLGVRLKRSSILEHT